jgi:hypothetical protein
MHDPQAIIYYLLLASSMTERKELAEKVLF